MTSAIRIDAVTKRYRDLTALAGVSLDIEEGEFFGLLGPNGAGKTTLISIIAGLARADSGHVSVLGHDVVDDFRQSRSLLGVVPQELVFDPFFTVRETLRIQSGYFGLRKNDAWIDEVMENLDLTGKADTNMRALSGGMKRRVLVAQALVHKPPVIVLDEPTAGVDVELRQALWKFVARLNAEGHTIVLTTHYLEEAQALCKRIAMLKAGKVVALDSTAQLLRRISGLQLVLSFASGHLPESLMRYALDAPAAPTAQRVALRLSGYHEVEPILAGCRAGGAQVAEMELHGTDLEDVFVQIMQGGSAWTSTPLDSDVSVARVSARLQHGAMIGMRTLLYKEMLRFWKVSVQTVAAPVLTAMLYLLIFAHVLESRVQVYEHVSYTAFLVPGLVMMSMLQNAFANSVSSLIQSKISGNLVFILLPPLSHIDIFLAYILASVVRGLAVGAGVLIVTTVFVRPEWTAVAWIGMFAFLGCFVMGTLGLIAGIWAEKFDQVAAFQNFLIMPATFLSGVFYSVHSLPPVWLVVSHLNPFFYMIDGFRYGFFGMSDVSPWTSLAIVATTGIVAAIIALRMLQSGYKLRR